jgi:hypothetical protein
MQVIQCPADWILVKAWDAQKVDPLCDQVPLEYLKQGPSLQVIISS